MTDPAPLLPALPDIFDGFRLEIDPARERADVILDRAPLNVITMAEREQLRAVFEALDADALIGYARLCPAPLMGRSVGRLFVP
jgi:2-oxoglutaroyl-CoA hydrolase